ncbi:hypothetical protein GCM10010214_16780 [Streptomyces abikoensis]|nr:hypothetical protein GCM10010214_16780 [Streptomyces abikoensis]
MAGPGAFAVAFGAGAGGEGAAAGVVGGADVELQLDAGAVLGEDEGRGEGEVLDAVAADLVGGADGEFDEGGAGQEDGAQDHVVGEPGVGADRQAGGEEEAVAAVGEFHGGGGAQQRVVGGFEAGGADVAGGGGGFGPVAAVLEGVRGEVGPPGRRTGEEGAPVDVRALDGQVGEGGDERGLLRPVLAEGGDGGCLVGEGFPGHGGEGAVGAEFQEAGDAFGVEGADAVGEADGFADVADPVVRGAQLVVVGEAAGDVGDDGQVRAGEGQGGDGGAEVVQHRFHQRGVERVGDPQPAGLAAVALEVGAYAFDGVLGAGDHDGGRAVDGGDGHVVGEQRQDFVLGGAEGGHGPAPRQGLHEPAPGGDEGAGVGQGEDARDVGGRDLAERVPGDVLGADAPGLHEPVQGGLDGEQPGLGVRRLVEEVLVLAPDHFPQGPVQMRVQPRAHRVEGVGEHGEAGVQFAAHAQALGALAGEEEGRSARGGRALDEAGVGFAGGECRQGPGEGFGAVAEDDGAVREAGPGRRQGEADVQDVPAGVVQQASGLGAQGGFRLAGEDPGHHARGHGGCLLLGGGLGLGFGLLQDDVGVGAADAEGGDGGAARAAGGGPVEAFGEQFDGAGRPVHVRGGLIDVEGAREDAVAHRHDRLDDAGDAGRGLGVADVGLDAAEAQRLSGGPVLAVGGEERLGLDGVAQRRTGAVGLDGVDLVGGELGVGEGGADDALLGGAVGGGEAAAGAVLVDGGAADDGEDAVAVAAGVGEAFDEEDADALRPAGAVGGFGEGLAAAVGGESALAGELGEEAGGGHHGDAARQGEGAFAGAQGADGEVEGDEGGGAGRVDGDGRAFEAEGVGDAAGQDAGGASGEQVALGLVGAGGERAVVGVGAADEDAGVAAAQGGGVDAGAFDGLPGRLEEQPLLGVHGQCLAGGDAEEFRVEVGRSGEEAALAHIALAGLAGLGVVEGVEVPAAVGGYVADRVDAAVDEPPQVLGGGDAAGEAAGHADDGDGLAVPGLDGLQPLLGSPQVRGDALEIVPELVFGAAGHGACFLPVRKKGVFRLTGLVRRGRVLCR